MSFKDHFSTQARSYAAFRPTYPPALFSALAAAAPSRALAWDVATGSGQAAVALAAHFERVVGTDASAEQLRHAEAHPRVTYRAEPAEASSFAAASVDLVTVAQALHWLDLERFWDEVRRVARPGAVVAAWSYGLMRVEAPGVDGALRRLHDEVMAPYWPTERAHVDDGYASLPFPFASLSLGAFEMAARWSLDELVGYLGTWSAVARYRKARGEDPMPEVRARLAEPWGAPETKHRMVWPLALRAGRTSPFAAGRAQPG